MATNKQTQDVEMQIKEEEQPENWADMVDQEMEEESRLAEEQLVAQAVESSTVSSAVSKTRQPFGLVPAQIQTSLAQYAAGTKTYFEPTSTGVQATHGALVSALALFREGKAPGEPKPGAIPLRVVDMSVSATKGPIYSRTTLTAALNEYAIPTLPEHKRLRQPVLVPAPTDVVAMAAVLEAKGLMHNPFMFFPDLNKGASTMVPTYIPTYWETMPDINVTRVAEILRDQAKSQYGVESSSFRNMKDLIHDITDSITDYYYGNGSLHGQMGRLRKVWDVAEFIRSRSKLNNYKPEELEDNLGTIMDRHVPLGKIPLSLKGSYQDVLLSITEFVHGDNLRLHDFYETNLPSDAGILWASGARSVKNDNVVIQNVLLADFILELLDATTPGNVDEALHYLGFLRLVKLKNKAEIYRRAEKNTKTRNIFAFDSFAQAPAQLILRGPHSRAPKFGEDNPDVWSISGFNPYNGGADRLVLETDRRVRAGKLPIWVYSDNLYIVVDVGVGGKHDYRWLSLDGEKMEGHIFASEIKFEMMRSLNAYNSADKAWQLYAERLYPMIAGSSVAVIGDHQIESKQLPSGTMGTSSANTLKTVRFAYHWTIDGKKWPTMEMDTNGTLHFDERAKQAMYRAGVSFTIEKSAKWDFVFLPGAETDLDLLGMVVVEATEYGSPGHFFAVLQRQRIINNLVYLKQGLVRATSEPDLIAARLARLHSLWLVGGFYYDGVAEIIQTMVAAENMRLTELGGSGIINDIGPWLTEAVGFQASGGVEEAALTNAASGATPNIAEVLDFHLGMGAGDRYIKMTYNLLNEEALKAHDNSILMDMWNLAHRTRLVKVLTEEVVDTIPPPEFITVGSLFKDTPTGSMVARVVKIATELNVGVAPETTAGIRTIARSIVAPEVASAAETKFLQSITKWRRMMDKNVGDRGYRVLYFDPRYLNHIANQTKRGKAPESPTVYSYHMMSTKLGASPQFIENTLKDWKQFHVVSEPQPAAINLDQFVLMIEEPTMANFLKIARELSSHGVIAMTDVEQGVGAVSKKHGVKRKPEEPEAEVTTASIEPKVTVALTAPLSGQEPEPLLESSAKKAKVAGTPTYKQVRKAMRTINVNHFTISESSAKELIARSYGAGVSILRIPTMGDQKRKALDKLMAAQKQLLTVMEIARVMRGLRGLATDARFEEELRLSPYQVARRELGSEVLLDDAFEIVTGHIMNPAYVDFVASL